MSGRYVQGASIGYSRGRVALALPQLRGGMVGAPAQAVFFLRHAPGDLWEVRDFRALAEAAGHPLPLRLRDDAFRFNHHDRLEDAAAFLERLPHPLPHPPAPPAPRQFKED